MKNSLPPELEMKAEFDQSIFVRAALSGVIKEALIAAALTAVMILLFLGTGGTLSSSPSQSRSRSSAPSSASSRSGRPSTR